ncbi:MAG: tetratricopeptide repeat protein, partial [Planctomycetota bacterium]
REAQADRVVLPRLEPLVVGNTVLAKTTDAEVLAIDLDTGLAKWAFYQNAAPAKLISLSSSVITGGLPDVAETLQSRVWSSSAFGRFTSDGLRFYYVTEENVSHAVGRRIGEGYNRLQGISIPAEGKILWQVGGPPDELGDDPLAGAYFLGAPLPYGGELYCIAEVNGETRLVVLDAATGRLRWSQQLVHPLYRQLRYDPERKSQAITPIVVDGIVICPTGAGAVVAVDLQMRRLLWGVAYDADRGGNSMAPFRRGNLIYGGREFNPLAPSWLDPGCIVEGGVVAFSPPESHIFFCLDLLTGDMVLPPQRREDGRYLAAVRNGRVVVVGERRALALDIASQSVAWETGYPDRSRLAGRGLMTERGLLIPLSGGRLIRIDADNGEVLESTVVDRELGNLVVYRGNLLSLSAARIAAFYTRDYLQEEVERRLAANPQDTWALNQQAQVAMADGQIDRAFGLLNRSLELNPRDVDTRFLLAETVMQGMKKDFDKYRGEAARLRDFVDGAQRFRFLQWLALGSIQAGEHAAAFAHLVDLVHQRTGAMLSGISMRPMEMQIDDSYAVDTDAWLATQLARAYAHASPQQREQMDALVVREMEVSERLIAPLRRQVLRYFGWHAAAQPQTLETAIALLDAGDSIVAEQLLVPLALGPPSHGRTPARALLARPSTIDKTQFGPRGRIVPSIFGLDNGLDPTLPPDLRGGAEDWQPDWPTGRLIELSVAQDQNPFSVGLQVPVRFERFGRPEFQLRLSGDTLLVFNQNGEDVGHISIDRASADSSDVFVRAAVRGSLLILETSSEVMGIDLYRGLQTGQDALIWRQSLMNPTAGPRTPFGMPNPTPVNTSFGVQIFHRESNGRRILVGPLTNSTLVLQVGGTLMGLDPYTGHQVWSRSGFDDRIRLSHRGSEVAIVEPSMGRTVFIDARDGMVLREEKHAGYWEHWFSSGPWMVDYREQQTAAAGGAGIHSASTLRPTLLIWNPFDDAQRHVLELERGTRAGVLEDRYLVILQPTGNLQFWDLETGRHVAHQAEVDQDLNDILVQRFGGTLLILSRATSENPPSRVLNLDSISRDFHPVNGWVYALDVQTGKMLWDRPAGLFWMYYPKNQPRNSPYVAAYRIESTRSNLAFLTLVLLDLRNGELAYTARRMPVRSPSHCVMELRPVSHTISIAVGGRTFLLRATDEPTPPQPVAYFGKIGPARSSTHPFQSFDLFR